MIKIRSGIGYDIHRLEKGDGIFIGGVFVPAEFRTISHSDGDVLLHALMDSLLGAIGEKDIGELFPDSDSGYKGIRSEILLKKVLKIFKKAGYEILNIDSVLISEKPKINPVKQAVRENVARLLGIPKADFNLKAKTKEKLDAVGHGKAIECFCMAMIRYKH